MTLSVMLSLVAAACSLGARELGVEDCRPRRLVRLDWCFGEDRTFQECHFYFRAIGITDDTLRAAMLTRASGTPLSPVCDAATPQTWPEVPCDKYRIPQGYRCFACATGKREAAQTYVYAFEKAGSTGMEQVTCNVDPVTAGRLLSEHRLNPKRGGR